MSKPAFASFVALIAASSAFAAGSSIETGNDVLRYARGTLSERSFLTGFIAGIGQENQGRAMWDELTKIKTPSQFNFCISPDVEIGQTTDVVTKWIENHPEKRHRLAVILIHDALTEAWPCK